jgi:anhydro-N-acetylmuramic acid kinase
MREPKAMVVAGVMSGTSADGVDVALVRVSPGRDGVPKLKLLGHAEFAYPKQVRAAVLQAAGGEMKVAELSRLNWKLGEVYAGCVEKTCEAHGMRTAGSAEAQLRSDGAGPKVGHMLSLIGLHGQTIYHEAPRATWQIGEAAVVAERLRVPVVGDFRPADLAAGGQGAPLVPMLDFCLFRSKTRNRVLLNLGGIANMTAIPAGAGLEDVIAFDSGPANMAIDALMRQEFGKAFDRGGKVAARGSEVRGVVDAAMREEYFARDAPKSCGREQFGAEFVRRFVEACGKAAGADLVATATALTWRSIYEAYARIVWPHLGQRAPLAKSTDLIVAGGGARNTFLMAKLQEAFAALGVRVLAADALGMPAQAKEAEAFALLAWLSWHGLAGNVPRATGASRAVALGKVTC